ncbi:hypothetical protein N7508_006873 [Penicillium antarcticum]|uniref:uncharacterized protein n=1 Tax=Penicillium antarcticum TaxID=416450 RepID=UPI002386C9C2|nr:uncharacterized protein N7508_006873 [Penicillium antarcticum]KAJ5302010.1 hypothetical protein N7508_006873 [Penicillium antarcticum]
MIQLVIFALATLTGLGDALPVNEGSPVLVQVATDYSATVTATAVSTSTILTSSTPSITTATSQCTALNNQKVQHW